MKAFNLYATGNEGDAPLYLKTAASYEAAKIKRSPRGSGKIPRINNRANMP
jgi:hypothetical protein